jgi:hypothetical protein
MIRVNDKGKAPRLRNVVMLILPIEGDHGFRPFQEGQGGLTQSGRVNLFGHELLLTSGLTGRWPTKYHEAPFWV